MTENEIYEKMESVGLNKIIDISFDMKGNPIIDFYISPWFELIKENNNLLWDAIIKASYDVVSVENFLKRKDLEFMLKNQYFYRIENRNLKSINYFDDMPLEDEVTFNVNDMYADILRMIDLID